MSLERVRKEYEKALWDLERASNERERSILNMKRLKLMDALERAEWNTYKH